MAGVEGGSLEIPLPHKWKRDKENKEKMQLTDYDLPTRAEIFSCI